MWFCFSLSSKPTNTSSFFLKQWIHKCIERTLFSPTPPLCCSAPGSAVCLVFVFNTFPSKPCNFLKPRILYERRHASKVLHVIFCHPSFFWLPPDLMSLSTAQAANEEWMYLHTGTDGDAEWARQGEGRSGTQAREGETEGEKQEGRRCVVKSSQSCCQCYTLVPCVFHSVWSKL